MKNKVKDSYLVKCLIIVFICFILDSTIAYFIPYNYAKTGITIVPCIGLMMFSLLVRTVDGVERYLFGAICGIYYSVVYSNSLAIYILIYTLIAFVRSYIIKIDSFSLPESIAFCISTIIAQEIMLYWLMWITNMTRYSIIPFVSMRVLPTIGVNLIFSILVYWIYNKVKIEVE